MHFFCFACKHTHILQTHLHITHTHTTLRHHLKKKECISFSTFQACNTLNTEDISASWTRIKQHLLETERSKRQEENTEDRERRTKRYKKERTRHKKRPSQIKSNTRGPDYIAGECPSYLAHPGSSLALLAVAAGTDNLPVVINSSSINNSNTNLLVPSLMPTSLQSWPPLHCHPPARPLPSTVTGTAKARWHQGGRLPP